MTTLSAGWAVVSKRPGADSDYSVLAASRAPFTPQQLNGLVLRYSPGNSPPNHEPPPAGLPWVWFRPAKVSDVWYLGVTIRRWTEQIDATNRPIAENRFFCVPLAEFASAGNGFADLYRAVADLAPPVPDQDPFGGAPITLRLADRPAASAPGAVLRHAAAALLDGPVALLGGPADLQDRLALLDAIGSLLPAGALWWLTASAWADAGTNHGTALSFAHRGRPGDAVVDLRAGTCGGRSLSTQAGEYKRVLAALLDSRGGPAVLAHLAGLIETCERDPRLVRLDVADLDLAEMLVHEARGGRLPLDLLRRLWDRGHAGQHTVDQRETVLTTYLHTATVDDLVRDREMLAAQWVPALNQKLADAFSRLLDRAPTGASVRTLAEVARGLGASDSFVRALSAAQESGTLTQPEMVTAVVDLIHDPHWTGALAPLAARSQPIAVAIAKRGLTTRLAATDQLIGALDAVGEQDSWWHRLRKPFAFLFGGSSTPTSADVDVLWHSDRELVQLLLETTQQQDPVRLNQVLEVVLPVLDHYSATTMPRPLTRALVGLPVRTAQQQATIDFIAYRQGIEPTRGLDTGAAYRKSLVDLVDNTELTEGERGNLVDFIAGWLRPDWGADAGQILDTLWELSHPTGRPAVVTDVLVNKIADAVRRNPEIFGIPASGRWLPMLEADPHLGRQVLLHRLARLPRDTSVDEVARIVAMLWSAHDIDERDLVVLVRNSKWRPASDPGHPASGGWLDLATRLTARLARAGVPHPHRAALVLLNAQVDGALGPVPPNNADELVRAAQLQLQLTLQVLVTAAKRLPRSALKPAVTDNLRLTTAWIDKLIDYLESDHGGGRVLGIPVPRLGGKGGKNSGAKR